MSEELGNCSQISHTKVHSITGLIDRFYYIVTERPYRIQWIYRQPITLSTTCSDLAVVDIMAVMGKDEIGTPNGISRDHI